MHPVLFKIPFINWPLHTYGILIVSGFLLAMFVAKREAERQGRYVDEIMDFAFYALLGGMIGARVVFILVNWREYAADPIKIVKIWEGGLVVYGALIGGLLAFLWYTKKHNILGIEKLRLADMIIVGVPLAQAFGRLGCVAAGCCWGEAAYHIDTAGQVVADIPLAAYFPQGSLAYADLLRTENADVVRHMNEMHTTMPLIPTQWIESISVAFCYLLLLAVRSRKWFHGQVLLTYGILYPIVRSLIETMRGDAGRGYVIPGVLSTSQFISLSVAAVSLFMIFYLRKKHTVAVAQ